MLSKWFPLMFLLSAGCLVGDLPGDDVIAADNRPWFLAVSEPKASVAPIYPSSNRRENPSDTVEDLAAKSGELSEPSRASEEQYVAAIRQWLDTLDPFQRDRARKIMQEAHPELQKLREEIRHKKRQLASISFDKGMPPETLPRLGMELQQLRSNLSAELRRVEKRLRNEAGVEMGPAAEDSYWLSPPPLLTN